MAAVTAKTVEKHQRVEVQRLESRSVKTDVELQQFVREAHRRWSRRSGALSPYHSRRASDDPLPERATMPRVQLRHHHHAKAVEKH